MTVSNSGPGQPTPAAAPPKVAEAAASKQLGTLVVSQQSANPIENLLVGIALTGGLGGVGALLAWAAVATQLRPLALFACLAIVAAVIVLIFSVLASLSGFTATYLYTNGLVHTKNGKVTVATWPEVDELRLSRAATKTGAPGPLLRYYVVTVDGRKIPVETSSKNRDTTLGEQLQQIVRGLGRPVRDK